MTFYQKTHNLPHRGNASVGPGANPGMLRVKHRNSAASRRYKFDHNVAALRDAINGYIF